MAESYTINKRPKDDTSEEDEVVEQKIESSVSERTKIAISSGYLLSSIISSYFDKNKCKNMTDDDHTQMVQSVLDNLFIAGGACRSLLLGKPVNDLDIQCNTRELNKIHLQHLQKYHSTKKHQETNNCSCALWNRYLNKFGQENKEYDAKMLCKIIQNGDKENQNPNIKVDKKTQMAKIKTSEDYIGGCNYILNSRMIILILANSNEFANSTKVKYFILIHGALIKITKALRFNGFDLYEQDFDILDTFNKNKPYEMTQNQQDIGKKDDFYVRRKSMKVASTIYNPPNNQDIIEIDLPIYATTLEDHFSHFDLSINCVFITLLSMRNIIDKYAVKKDGKYDIDNNICDRMRGEVRALPMYDVKAHFKNKFLTTRLQTIIDHSPLTHFWRVVKFFIRFHEEGWTVDDNLTKHHKNLYKEWIDNDIKCMNKASNRDEFMRWNWNYGYAKNKKEYALMMKAFEHLGFHKKFKDALKRNGEFRKQWIGELNKKNKDIVDVFESNGYPIKFVETKKYFKIHKRPMNDTSDDEDEN